MTGIPNDKNWARLDQRPFHGTIPTQREDFVFQAIHFMDRNNTPIEEVRNKYRRFRSEKFFGMFHTDKILHGCQYENIVVFDTSAYEDYTHTKNLDMFQILANAFQYDHNVVEIHSISKDRHDGSRDRSRPFARDHVALLVVRIVK
jgi:uncharacterized Fe-S cluster-containing radical SAM superfamily protein